MKGWKIMLIALVFVLGFLFGHKTGKRVGNGGTRERVDTLIVYRTKAADSPRETASRAVGTIAVPMTRWAFFTDTIERENRTYIAIHDTVYLEREEKYYSELDGRLRMWVSGYEPSLDRWELDEKETTVRVTPKKPRWSVGIGAGYGIGKNGLTPMAGVTIGYDIISW